MKKIFTIITIILLTKANTVFAQNLATTSIETPISNATSSDTSSENFVTLGLSSDEVKSGETVKLSWSSSGVRLKIPMCNLYKNEDYIGRVGRGGYVNVKIDSTTNFKINCFLSNGKTISDNITVNVKNINPVGDLKNEISPTTSVYFAVSNATVTEFSWVNLRWIGTKARKTQPACQLFEGDKPIVNVDYRGNWSVYPERTNLYKVRCYDDDGRYAEATKQVAIDYNWDSMARSATGTVKMTLSRNEIYPNEPVILSWESTGTRAVNACQLMRRKGVITSVASSGSIKLTPTQSHEYRIRCMDEKNLMMTDKANLVVKADAKADLYNASSKNAFARFIDGNVTVFAKRMSFLYWETSGVREGGGGCQLFETDRDGGDKYLTDIVRNGRWPVYPEITTTYTIKCFDAAGAYTTYSKTYFVKRF